MSTSREGTTHWCYSCGEPITLWRQYAAECSSCGGGFVQELDNAFSMDDTMGAEEANQRPRFMQTVSNFLRQHMAVRLGVSDVNRISEQNGNSWDSFLVFSGDMPARMPASGGLLEFINESLGFRRDHGGDYFIGPGVEELFEHVTSSDQRVPPPASRSSIDALPTIKISKKHIRADTMCAVCKDLFVLGSQVRKLPCKHLYHSECIVPWLEQRRSCPICRHELTDQQLMDGYDTHNNSREQNRSRRRRWPFLWRFRSSRSAPSTNTTVESHSHPEAAFTDYSHWPFEC